MLDNYLFLIFFEVEYIHLRWCIVNYLYYCTSHTSTKSDVCPTRFLDAEKVLTHGSIPGT